MQQGLHDCRIKTEKQPSNQEVNKLDGLSDLDMYVVLMVQCRLVREYVDISAVFIMAPGFAIMVTSNYVVIKLFEKIPLLLYLAISLLVLLVPVIVLGELPEAGKSHTHSVKLLKFWKGSSATKRTPWGRRKVRSLHPIGYWVGPFFLIKQQTF